MFAAALLVILGLHLHSSIEEARFRTLQSAISDGDTLRYSKTHEMIWKYHDRQRLLRLLANDLGRCSGRMQNQLIFGLARFGREAEMAIPTLIKIANDSKSKNRSLAVYCLGQISPTTESTISTLKVYLRDKDINMRLEACVTVWRLERRPETIAPVLNASLASDDAYDRGEALRIIGIIGDGVKEAVAPAIIKIAKSKDEVPTIQIDAYELLPTFAPDQATAANILVAALVRNLAGQKLLDTARKSGKISLQNYTFSCKSAWGEQRTIMDILVSLGDAAVPELIGLIQPTHDVRTRTLALGMIATLGKRGHGKATATVIQRLMADPNPTIRSSAERAMKAIGTY